MAHFQGSVAGSVAGSVQNPLDGRGIKNTQQSECSEEARPLDSNDIDEERSLTVDEPTASAESHKFTQLLAVLKPKSVLIEHSSYHGEITGEQAYERLKLCAINQKGLMQGPYIGHLIRYSAESECNVLEVYQRNPDDTEVYRGFRIYITEENGRQLFHLEPTLKHAYVHNSLDDLIHYHETKPLDTAFKTIGTSVSEEYYVGLYRVAEKNRLAEEAEKQRNRAEASEQKLEQITQMLKEMKEKKPQEEKKSSCVLS